MHEGEVAETVLVNPIHLLASATRYLFLALLVAWATFAQAQERFITVASTTSTAHSGLFEHLLPIFEKKTGIYVRVVAVGTGEALDVARGGGADVVLVHAKAAEQKFVAEGHGMTRFPVMYNDFVLVGPNNDPARVAESNSILEALSKIRRAGALFVSRGDRSGTHLLELELWSAAAIDIDKTKGNWYRNAKQGMGPALITAASIDAYILTDRGTWLAFEHPGDLTILVEGDERLFNQYSVILVNPQKHPNVKNDLGQAFVDWLISPEGQKAIADYKINGKQLFFPNASQPGLSQRTRTLERYP